MAMGSKDADAVAARGGRERSIDRQDLPQPANGSLAARKNADQADDAVVVAAITLVVREADAVFERVGGSSRHWVRDCFLPTLNKHGWFVEASREDDVPLPFPARHPIACAICGCSLTDGDGIALVRIQVDGGRWTCARHDEEAAGL
jgi:hypothetical protein